MSFRRMCSKRFSVLGCCLLLAGATLFGGEKSMHFELRSSVFTPTEGQPVTQYMVVLETNQIAFLPPANWNVKVSPREYEVMMSPLDGSIQIKFRLLPEFAGKTNSITKQVVLPLLNKAFPGATIKGESPFTCGSGAGVGYEINRTVNSDVVKLNVNVGFVQLPIGLMEFQLLCPPSQMEAMRIPYSRFLLSFSLEPKTSAK